MTYNTPTKSIISGAVVGSILALLVGGVDAAEIGDTGQLAGQSDHVTVGTVTIERDGDRTFVVLGDDFSLDGAPSPTLGFSTAGAFVDASEFAELENLTGAQRYEVPADLDLSEFDAFVVWCSQFDIPLGSAPLD